MREQKLSVAGELFNAFPNPTIESQGPAAAPFSARIGQHNSPLTPLRTPNPICRLFGADAFLSRLLRLHLACVPLWLAVVLLSTLSSTTSTNNPPTSARICPWP